MRRPYQELVGRSVGVRGEGGGGWYTVGGVIGPACKWIGAALGGCSCGGRAGSRGVTGMAVGSDSCSPCSKLVCCLSYIPFHLFDSAASIVAPGTTRRRHSAWRPARLGAGGRQCEPGPSPVTAGLLDCQRAVLRPCLTRQYSAHASACRLFGNANQNPRPSRWGCSAVNGLLCAFDTRSVVRYGAHDHGCGHALTRNPR